jgi:hypothetical protein
MNAVLGSILENLNAIDIIEQPTLSVFAQDKLSTSDGRELTVKGFLEKYLPQDYVVKKGAIFSLKGSSNNIDCVVLSPSHPKLFTPVREVIIAEGVYAAVEVKPDIRVLTDNSEFFRGLTQAKSVKNLSREVIFLTPNHDYYKKIPFVLFSLKGADPISTINFIIEKINEKKFAIDEIPDIIVQMDKGVILYNPYFSSTPFGQLMESKYPKAIFGDAGFMFIDTQDKGNILSMFLLFFLKLNSPQPVMNEFILNKYLLDGLSDESRGMLVKFFPVHNPYGYDVYTRTWKVPNGIDLLIEQIRAEYGIDDASLLELLSKDSFMRDSLSGKQISNEILNNNPVLKKIVDRDN